MTYFWIDISAEPISPDKVWSYLAASEGGGINIFVGATRRLTQGRVTVRLAYEAHESMALKEMASLAESAASKWDVLRIAILHRTGEVSVSEPSVIIGVASSHRAEAFAASRFLIDELKISVPIWKKEIYEDGETQWKDAKWERP
ncbi:MAG: molybdenum cofactor biosynthesis protein MoaE [Bacteroidetes bacterium]|nr:molybdenum cofactor biosynthesis protein MoaE [Bacteroidota bacterium]MDA1333027.1 molybdenum cofactor biosynthesis protein MoaE [Bacteroidota bacterium]